LQNGTEPDARIITQGDIGDLFYIIEKGTAIITEDDSDKRLVFDAGRFFGEIALIENVPRTAHIHAGEGGASCLTLDRAAYLLRGIFVS
jgi:CRP-like cAMP-binding protein